MAGDVSRPEPQVSIVLPVYRNRDTVDALYRRLQHVLDAAVLHYEMIFVNDACPDNSLAPLTELTQRDARVTALALERNLGQHRAVLVGLRRARGSTVIIMDADLQDPPEAIPQLLAKISEGYAAVFAGRRGRYESSGRLFTSWLFKILLHGLCGVPRDAGMFVAINRNLVERLSSWCVSRPFVVAMIGAAGLPMTSVPVARSLRRAGVSGYSFLDRFKAGLTAIRCVMTCKRIVKRPQPGCRMELPVSARLGKRFRARW